MKSSGEGRSTASSIDISTSRLFAQNHSLDYKGRRGQWIPADRTRVSEVHSKWRACKQTLGNNQRAAAMCCLTHDAEQTASGSGKILQTHTSAKLHEYC